MEIFAQALVRTAVDAMEMVSSQGSEKALYDVLKTERAVAGEPFAFAAATQVLSVRPFRVYVACRPWTRTACLLAALEHEI